jgi:hypothetical protein
MIEYHPKTLPETKNVGSPEPFQLADQDAAHPAAVVREQLLG